MSTSATRSYLSESEIVIPSPSTQPAITTTTTSNLSNPSYQDILRRSNKEREVDELVARKHIHPKPSWKARAIRILTVLQRGSAPFLTVFVTIHLAAPIVANFGGSELSTRTMLLGREYYQGVLTEPLLLLIPLGIHISSGIFRRILIKLPKRPTLVQVTAYTALITVPIHKMIHRDLPSSPAPPIYSLSPSEMNYEFIKTGFTFWPALTWVAYSGLAGVVLVHMVEGGSIILKSWTGWGWKKTHRRVTAGVIWGLVMSGLFVVSREPLGLRGIQLDRVLAVYATSKLHPAVAYVK